MIGNLLRVSNTELQSYLENSVLLEERVYPEEEEVNDPCLFDLDKCWEYIYFLLTGCTSDNVEHATPPLSLILFTGALIDENQDMGYGPASYASAEQVKEITAALPDIKRESLPNKFDSLKSKGAQLYPYNPESEDIFDYIFDHYTAMKEFYELAAKNNQAVISFIS